MSLALMVLLEAPPYWRYTLTFSGTMSRESGRLPVVVTRDKMIGS